MSTMNTGRFERTRHVRALLASSALVFGWISAPAKADSIIQYAVPTAASLPYGITVGPDSNIWFLEYDGNKIGQLAPNGVFLNEFPIPTPTSRPIAITTGPDGNLWFTERNGGKIGRVTTAGAFAEYTVPGGNPYSIAAGPDGNLWFTDSGNHAIGKMSPAGVILNEFPLPSGGVASGIASGPDGNLWFGAYSAIGKITPSGVITKYPIPTGGADVEGIVSGPDGNLWFTEYVGNRIGKITTTGVITEYPIPTLHSGAEGISSGPDGNIWFVENNVGKVAAVTTAGMITEYTFSNGPWENPGAQIVGSPDGDLWFSFGASNSIYKVTTLQAPLVSMTFNPSYLTLSGTSSDYGPSALTITLSNPNTVALTGVAFTDIFPAGLYGTYATSTCGGSLGPSTSSFTFTQLSGGSIPPNGSCWVGVDIYPNATGRFVNSTGPVTSDNAATSAGASAALTVRQIPSLSGSH